MIKILSPRRLNIFHAAECNLQKIIKKKHGTCRAFFIKKFSLWARTAKALQRFALFFHYAVRRFKYGFPEKFLYKDYSLCGKVYFLFTMHKNRFVISTFVFIESVYKIC